MNATRRNVLQPPGWVNLLSPTTVTRPDSWPPRSSRDFDWSKPTNEAYYDPDEAAFPPAFAQARSLIDYSYHRNPALNRQEFQDTILSRIATTETTKSPWIVFTAGAMGVGKGYVLSTLNSAGLIPLHKFLKIDPDMLKSELPEQAGYLQADPKSAATKLHRESTQMADVLLEHALLKRTHILVDGSLRNVDWNLQLFDRIRTASYKIAILHVTSSRETVHARAEMRAQLTGRTVPRELIDESIEQVPRSVSKLSPKADVVYEIINEEGHPLQLKSSKQGSDSFESWMDFGRTWDGHVEDSRMNDMVCHMSSAWDDSHAHEEANGVWRAAYPNFCARCALACDGQCGVCIHGKHSCACPECKRAIAKDS